MSLVAISITAAAQLADAQALTDARAGIASPGTARAEEATFLPIAVNASTPTHTDLLPFVLGGTTMGLAWELLAVRKRIGHDARLKPIYTPSFMVGRGALVGGSTGAFTGQIVRAFRDDAAPRRAPLILTGALLGASLAASAAMDEVASTDVFFGEIFVAAAGAAGGVTGGLFGFFTHLAARRNHARRPVSPR